MGGKAYVTPHGDDLTCITWFKSRKTRERLHQDDHHKNRKKKGRGERITSLHLLFSDGMLPVFPSLLLSLLEYEEYYVEGKWRRRYRMILLISSSQFFPVLILFSSLPHLNLSSSPCLGSPSFTMINIWLAHTMKMTVKRGMIRLIRLMMKKSIMMKLQMVPLLLRTGADGQMKGWKKMRVEKKRRETTMSSEGWENSRTFSFITSEHHDDRLKKSLSSESIWDPTLFLLFSKNWCW